MLCIANILEFAHIKIGDGNCIDADKIKNIRNYIDPKRNTLVSLPINYEAVIDIEQLNKYFDKPFLNCVSFTKSQDTVSRAYFIAERFDLHHLLHEISHIIDCIKYRKFQIGWQFSLYENSKNKYPVIQPLFEVVNDIVKNKNNISQLSISLNDNNTVLRIDDKLPLLLIQRAISEYYDNHKEEFEFDIVKTVIEDNVANSSYNITYLNEYQDQQNRFVVKLCASLYDFLLNESPPSEKIFSATDHYALIIGLILQKSDVFRHQMDSEYTLINKVKQWLADSELSNL